MNEDGTMARMPQLESFAERHNMPIVQVADLVHYRLQNESLIERTSERDVESVGGGFVRSPTPRRWGASRWLPLCSATRTRTSWRGFVCTPAPLDGYFGGGVPGATADLDLGFRSILEKGSGVVLYLARPVQVPLLDAMATGEHPPTSGEPAHHRYRRRCCATSV